MTIRTWVDIEDAAGAKLGGGPVVSVMDWQQTARLDRAGDFAFRMPATDARAAEVRPKRYARCWHAGPEGVKSLGYGRIERVELRESPTGPVLEVSGSDLLGELSDRIMRRVGIKTEIREHPAQTIGWGVGQGLLMVDGDLGDTTTYTTMSAPGDGGRFAAPYKFHAMTFTLGATVNTNAVAIGLDYSKTGVGQWGTATILSDTTQAVAGHSLSGSGTVTLAVPSDWEPPTGEMFYVIKIRAGGGGLTDVDISDVTVTYWGPSLTALDDIMDYAPDGWSLDAANGYSELQYRPLTGTEMMLNSSFETYATNGANQEFTSWTNVIAGTANINNSATAYVGSASVKLTTTGATGGSTDGALIYQDVTVTGDTEYTLSFWTQGDGTHMGQWRLEDGDDPGTYLTNTADTMVTAAEWTQITRTFTTPTGFTNLRVEFFSPLIGSGAYALFDNVSLQAGGGNSIYLQCSDESVLEMLIRVAEATGEHFILSPDGRKVLWLGNDERTLALRAVSNVNPVEVAGVDDIAIITDITETEDSADVVTRVYPYGAGMGASRVTLASATTEPPAGYVMSTANNYVERTAAITEFGVVEVARSWSDIVEQSDDTTAAAQSAANILLIQAVNWLSTHSATSTDRLTGDVPRFYTLGLAKCERLLLPGYKLRVVHHRWVDGYHAVAIDRDLWINAATWRVGPNGAETVKLDVATVDRQPVNDAIAIATGIRRIVGLSAHNTAAGY